MTPIEPRPHIEALEQPASADVIALPAGPAWWRTTIAELDERDAAARRRLRELRLELAAASVDKDRAEARVAVRDRRVAQLEQELRGLRTENRVVKGRADRAASRLAAIEKSRLYRLVQLSWRARQALRRPFRRH